eukprot:2092086-Amphidinium_carterae.1
MPAIEAVLARGLCRGTPGLARARTDEDHLISLARTDYCTFAQKLNVYNLYAHLHMQTYVVVVAVVDVAVVVGVVVVVGSRSEQTNYHQYVTRVKKTETLTKPLHHIDTFRRTSYETYMINATRSVT